MDRPEDVAKAELGQRSPGFYRFGNERSDVHSGSFGFCAGPFFGGRRQLNGNAHGLLSRQIPLCGEPTESVARQKWIIRQLRCFSGFR